MDLGIRRGLGSPQSLSVATSLLGFEPTFFGSERGARGTTRGVHLSSLKDERDQPRQCVVPIAFLAAKAFGFDDQYPFASETSPCEFAQATTHVFRERRRHRHVKAQLHSGRNFIHVLPAGAGCAHKVFLDFAFVDRNAGGDLNHQR